MNVEETLEKYVLTELSEWMPEDADSSALTRQSDLIEEGLIDSMGLLILIGFIEKEFNIKVETNELTAENFQSIRRIAEFVTSKQQGDAPLPVEGKT